MTTSTLDAIEARLKALSDWHAGPLPSKAEIEWLLAIAQAAERGDSLKLLADHSVAMEFVREASELPCSCESDGYCIACRATSWLHNGAPSASPR